jgi:hypothetical protein
VKNSIFQTNITASLLELLVKQEKFPVGRVVPALLIGVVILIRSILPIPKSK